MHLLPGMNVMLDFIFNAASPVNVSRKLEPIKIPFSIRTLIIGFFFVFWYKEMCYSMIKTQKKHLEVITK